MHRPMHRPMPRLIANGDAVEHPYDSGDEPAPALSPAQRVKAAFAEAEAASRALVVEYADLMDALAQKAGEVAELGSHAPGGIAQNAALLSERIAAEASGIRMILSKA